MIHYAVEVLQRRLHQLRFLRTDIALALRSFSLHFLQLDLLKQSGETDLPILVDRQMDPAVFLVVYAQHLKIVDGNALRKLWHEQQQIVAGLALLLQNFYVLLNQLVASQIPFENWLNFCLELWNFDLVLCRTERLAYTLNDLGDSKRLIGSDQAVYLIVLDRDVEKVPHLREYQFCSHRYRQRFQAELFRVNFLEVEAVAIFLLEGEHYFCFV